MAKKKSNRDGIFQKRGQFWMSFQDSRGKRHQCVLKGVISLTEAKKRRALKIAEIEKHKAMGYAPPTKDTFAVFAEVFLQYQHKRISPTVVKGKLSQHEYERQEGIINSHLVPFFGAMKLASIRRKEVNEYIDSRMGAVSDGTIIKEVNVAKRLFTIAVDMEKLHVNPAHKANLPKAPEGRNRWIRVDEWHRLFAACALHETDWSAVSRIGKLNQKRKAEGLSAIVPIEQKLLPPEQQWLQQAAALSVSLGTRRGELLHTSLPDIDLDRRSILLRKTKNGKPRLAFINDPAMIVLDAMQVRERKERGDLGPLFVGINPQQLTTAFGRAVKRAGIEDFSLHDLRHCYASHLRMNGADLHDLMVLLGHSDMRMTARYSHLSNEHLASTAQRLNGVLTMPQLATDDATEFQGKAKVIPFVGELPEPEKIA